MPSCIVTQKAVTGRVLARAARTVKAIVRDQSCRASARVRRQPETFCFSLARRMSRAVVVRRHPQVHGEPQVVVLMIFNGGGYRGVC